MWITLIVIASIYLQGCNKESVTDRGAYETSNPMTYPVSPVSPDRDRSSETTGHVGRAITKFSQSMGVATKDLATKLFRACLIKCGKLKDRVSECFRGCPRDHPDIIAPKLIQCKPSCHDAIKEACENKGCIEDVLERYKKIKLSRFCERNSKLLNLDNPTLLVIYLHCKEDSATMAFDGYRREHSN